MRITGPLLKVLRVLLEEAPTGTQVYGLDLMRRTSLKSGTLYPILQRLETAGWVSGRWDDVDPARVGRGRRRFYQLTPLGVHESHLVFAEYGQQA